MKEYLCFSLIFCFVVFSCEKDRSVRFLESCSNGESDLGFSLVFKRKELTLIEVKPKHYKKRALYSLLEKNDNWYICETSQNGLNYTIFDLKNGKIIRHDSLQTMAGGIGITTFRDFDSLYFQIPEKSRLFRFDTTSAIKENINMSALKHEWMLDDSPFGIHNGIPQGKILFSKGKDRIIFSIDPFDFWYYPDKTAIKLITEYDFTTSSITANFGERINYITKGDFELPDRYTYPFLALYDNLLYVSYPFDHQVYKYDLNSGRLAGVNCISSGYIKKLPEPLKKFSSIQESMKFQLSSPYYGQLNFHKDLNLFTRLVFHENRAYDENGDFRKSTCEQAYSLLVFDSDLNIVNEIDLGNQDFWDQALAVSKGYLLPGKCNSSKGDNYFKYNYYYELVKE